MYIEILQRKCHECDEDAQYRALYADDRTRLKDVDSHIFCAKHMFQDTFDVLLDDIKYETIDEIDKTLSKNGRIVRNEFISMMHLHQANIEIMKMCKSNGLDFNKYITATDMFYAIADIFETLDKLTQDESNKLLMTMIVIDDAGQVDAHE